MNILDDQKLFKKFDREGINRAIDQLADQAQQAWIETRTSSIPTAYSSVSEVIMNGMGGSGLAGHIIEAAFRERMRVPFFLTHSYDVPAHVGPKTLYILSSYSGDTEEVLATLEIARLRKAKLLGISSGGKLAREIEQKKIIGYRFAPTYNHGDKPRYGLGYTIFGLLGLLRSCKLISIGQQGASEGVDALISGTKLFGLSVATAKNKAKQLAEKLADKIPIFVGAEFLEDSARIISNQLHETSKQFGFHFAIPELNHHLIEGLAFPKDLKKKLIFIFFVSSLNHERIQKRFDITEAVIKKQSIPTYRYQATAPSAFAQINEILSFGSYLTYYLGILNKIDPAPNPWVDYFKKQLMK